jgi:hypothetical protein
MCTYQFRSVCPKTSWTKGTACNWMALSRFAGYPRCGRPKTVAVMIAANGATPPTLWCRMGVDRASQAQRRHADGQIMRGGQTVVIRGRSSSPRCSAWCCPSDGLSSGQSPGSIEAVGWPRTGNALTDPLWRSCDGRQFAWCCESSVRPQNDFGQTLSPHC